jgi:hypothetical protein
MFKDVMIPGSKDGILGAGAGDQETGYEYEAKDNKLFIIANPIEVEITTVIELSQPFNKEN